MLAATARPDEALKELEGVPGPAAARQRVQLLFAAGKNEEGIKAIEESVAASPGSIELSNLQIETLIKLGRFADAEKLLQQRLSKSDLDDAARFYVAQVKLTKQPPDVSGALKDLTNLSERNPRALHVHALLGDAHYAAGDIPAAVDDLNRALELSPLNRELRLKLIDWCSGISQWEMIKTVAEEALRNPRLANDPAWPRALARANASTGKFAEAEKQIVRAISMVPPEKAGDFELDYLSILSQAKNYAKILKLTDPWLAKGRKEWWIYQYRGVAKAGAKDKSAFKEFDAALSSIKPEEQFSIAQTIIRTISSTLGVDEGLKRIEKWEGGSPQWRLVAAELCMGKGDAAAGLTHLLPLEKEVDKLPKELQALFYRNLGQCYHQLSPGNLPKAAVAYEKYLQIKPNDVLALNNLAYLLAEEISPPRPKDARVYSKKAYDIAVDWRGGDPKSRIFDTHGWIMVLNEGSGVDEGIRILEQVIEEYPLLEARYHLGEAHLRKKHGEEAEEQLNAAMAMIVKAKKEKTPYDETLQPRIESALARAKALNAAAAR